jgi:hypothetical protein
LLFTEGKTERKKQAKLKIVIIFSGSCKILNGKELNSKYHPLELTYIHFKRLIFHHLYIKIIQYIDRYLHISKILSLKLLIGTREITTLDVMTFLTLLPTLDQSIHKGCVLKISKVEKQHVQISFGIYCKHLTKNYICKEKSLF